MSFDTLLTVVFVVVFIVLPLVSRVLRERNRPPSSRGGPARPPAPGDTPTATTSPDRQGQGDTGQGDGEQSDLPAWVLEAQRRVREARERAGAEASTQPPRRGTLVSEDPFEPLAPADRRRTMVPEDPFRGAARSGAGERKLVPEDPFERSLVGPGDAQRAGPGLGREGAPPPPPAARSATEATPPRRPVPPRAPRREDRPRAPSSVEEGGPRVMRTGTRRHGGHAGARLVGVGQVRFDREAIVRGLIWHEILDEPAWKRLRGRVPSRRRSR